MNRATRIALLISTLALGANAWADRLDDVKKAGVLRVAAFDANPPFGFVDSKTRKIVGLDVDYAHALAKKLGVKLEVVPTNPANRVPLLTAGKVDLVLANFTITEERKQAVNFSIPYFASGTQFIAKKGFLKSPEQLSELRIGVDKGTTNEIQLRQQYPKATLVAYDDTPFAFAALRNGNVQAISQDGPKLIGLLANVPDKDKYEVPPFAISQDGPKLNGLLANVPDRDKYEVPPFAISQDYIGVGVPKGETALTEFVNQTLRELEADGRAQKIYDTWFGPKSKTPLKRIYKIGDKAAG